MMKSVIAAAAIVAFGATSAAAACGWKAKQDTVADLDVKTEQQQTAKQSTPADASKAEDRTAKDRTAGSERTSERLQLAVDPRADDAANN
ncbi:MAG: hypothetical protein U5L06_05255 [Rhodovibrio sp.]|nr:hypothetical protein [Rhodovibrio sp.]